MTKKTRLILIAIFAFIACLCLFAGCTLKPSLEDVLGNLNQNGAVVDVTYFANEGSFSGNTKVRNLRCKAGSKAINLGIVTAESGAIALTSPTKYELDGWYEAELDSDGNPLYEDGKSYEFDYDTSSFDTQKNIKATDSLFDFEKTTLEEGKHYYLVAKWKKVKIVQVVLAGEVSSIKIGEATYNNGDLINEIAYESNGQIPVQSNAVSGTVSGATFIEFYADSNCSEVFKGWPIKLSDHVDDPEDEPFTIYARYIEGSWTVVKKSSDVTAMFRNANTAGGHYFIFGEIDCSSSSVSARTGTAGFACEIVGDVGSKIKGLTVTSSFTMNQVAGASLFGAIKSTAIIKNLELENIKVVYTFNESSTAYSGVYFAFSSLAEGATIENVRLSGTMTVKLGGSNDIKNIYNGASSNWKFGGYDDDNYDGGITVNAELNITEN